MWLFTKIGFFSAVQKTGTDELTIRARVYEDLERLREQYLPDLSPTIGHAGTDYPWRATVAHSKFAAALGRIALDVDYGNFKNEVAKSQGKDRAARYGKVWSVLYDLPEHEYQLLEAHWLSAVANGQKVAYGGVVFDERGFVLLREPRNHFDGYVWTFAKGRPDPGETPAQTALREVNEETGVEARIVGALPNDYRGGTTINRYFLMLARSGEGYVDPDDRETASIAWCSPEEAVRRIGETKNQIGRERDLAVLADALNALPSVGHTLAGQNEQSI